MAPDRCRSRAWAGVSLAPRRWTAPRRPGPSAAAPSRTAPPPPGATWPRGKGRGAGTWSWSRAGSPSRSLRRPFDAAPQVPSPASAVSAMIGWHFRNSMAATQQHGGNPQAARATMSSAICPASQAVPGRSPSSSAICPASQTVPAARPRRPQAVRPARPSPAAHPRRPQAVRPARPSPPPALAVRKLSGQPDRPRRPPSPSASCPASQAVPAAHPRRPQAVRPYPSEARFCGERRRSSGFLFMLLKHGGNLLETG